MSVQRARGVLLLCVVLAGCQSRNTAALDPEEQQWIAEERIIPPTGGPVTAPPAISVIKTLPQPAGLPSEAPASAGAKEGASAGMQSAAPPQPAARPAEPQGAQSAGALPVTSVAEHVRVSIYPSTIITCEGPLEVDYEHAKAVFHDDVHVTDERGELFADVMEVFFTPAHEIERVIATGNVRIVRGDDTAYCERAVYQQQEGKVFLTGQPKLVMFPETVQQVAGSRQPFDAAQGGQATGNKERDVTHDAPRTTHDEAPHE